MTIYWLNLIENQNLWLKQQLWYLQYYIFILTLRISI